MGSKYLQKFPVSGAFPDLLHDFAREILRDQPDDIYEYGAAYFRAMEQVRKKNHNFSGSRVQVRKKKLTGDWSGGRKLRKRRSCLGLEYPKQ